jgi:hypothetical protein
MNSRAITQIIQISLNRSIIVDLHIIDINDKSLLNKNMCSLIYLQTFIFYKSDFFIRSELDQHNLDMVGIESLIRPG